MLKKYFFILVFFAHTALAAETSKQQIEIILFKNNSANSSYDNTLFLANAKTKYKMHSYYEPQYQNLITSALSNLTFTNFENKVYSSVINQTVLAKNDEIIADDEHLSYYLLSEHDKQLGSIKEKLMQQKNNEIILHIAWQQDHDTEKRYLIDGSILDTKEDVNASYNLVYGTVTTKNSNNLDIEFDLILDNGSGRNNFSASRRVKAGQLNYIDNDNYGMLILLSNVLPSEKTFHP